MKIIMKKSILLNEDEKSRILNLHETAKNLYENKKPVSSIKEDKTKKEDMKKVIKLTESDLEKIVKRVIEEQYMGVAFGGEQNGLKIKKMETKEQAMGTQVAPQSNVMGKPKVDQAIVSKVQSSFPTPSKDPKTGQMAFLRTQNDSAKYDKVVKFLLNTSYGKMAGVVDLSTITPDTPNATNIMGTGSNANSAAMNALYTGIKSIMNYGYDKALQGLTAYGARGENVRAMAKEYLDDLGVQYS
jgi:hypothetical protein